MSDREVCRPCETAQAVCEDHADMGSCDRFPVAMAYVRWQKLDQMYRPELALSRGTLFPELDKPFCGRTVTGGKR